MKYKCLVNGTDFNITTDGSTISMGFLVSIIVEAHNSEQLEFRAIQAVEKTDVVISAINRGEYGSLSKLSVIGITEVNTSNADMEFNWYPMNENCD